MRLGEESVQADAQDTDHRCVRATVEAGTNSELQKGEVPDFELSRWSRSRAKRILDLALVFACFPVLMPLLVVVGLAVFLTSGAPVIFCQCRLGKSGVPFSIYKFRTMRRAQGRGGSAIASESAKRVTWLGFLLRRSKLDELPQIWNVLAGDMSLVGPRPKVPEQQLRPLPCRPGLTGAATLAFAREESLLAPVPPEALQEFFQDTVLPAKHRIDALYMRNATLRSDLRIVADTILGRWETYACPVQWRNEPEKSDPPPGQIVSICP